jgi:hypothetical protein
MSNIGELMRETKDRPAHVKFERMAVENKAASMAAGQYIAMDVDYVTVTVVGGGGNGVKWKIPQWKDHLKREVQNGRIPQQWLDDYMAMYERWKNGQELPLNGTPIRGWMLISPAQQETLIHRGILTLEDLASLNAEGIQRIGMGGSDLKNKAILALQASKDTGPLVMKVADLEQKLAVALAGNADLAAKVQLMQSQFAGRAPAEFNADEPADEGITAADILDEPDEDLRDRYQRKFGQAPHHRMKRETIERALRE